MAHKRFTTSDISSDEDIAAIAAKDTVSALMWPWFLIWFDDWGRMDVTSAAKLKLNIFPGFTFTPDAIEKAIESYVEVGLVHMYSNEEKRYLAIEPCKYYKYQTYIRDDKRNNDRSNFPAPINPPWANCSKCNAFFTGSARLRASARDCVQVRASACSCIPSPSPSINNSSSGCKANKAEGQVFQVFNNNIGPVTQFQAELIGHWLDEGFDPDMLIECILDSLGAGNKWSYLKGTVEACGAKNVKTLAQYMEDKRSKKAGDGNAGNSKKHNSSTNSKPVSGIGFEV